MSGTNFTEASGGIRVDTHGAEAALGTEFVSGFAGSALAPALVSGK
jgi:hypothetical protein